MMMVLLLTALQIQLNSIWDEIVYINCIIHIEFQIKFYLCSMIHDMIYSRIDGIIENRNINIMILMHIIIIFLWYIRCMIFAFPILFILNIIYELTYMYQKFIHLLFLWFYEEENCIDFWKKIKILTRSFWDYFWILWILF